MVGVATGALVGAGLALLFAPKAGRALREDIGDTAETLRSAVSDWYRDMADRAGVEIDNLNERVERATSVIESGAKDAVAAAARKVSSQTEHA